MSSLDSCNCSFRSLQLACLDRNLLDRNVSEFSQEDQELLWLRSGIDEVANASICYLHQKRLLVDFIKNQKKTCATFLTSTHQMLLLKEKSMQSSGKQGEENYRSMVLSVGGTFGKCRTIFLSFEWWSKNIL